MRLFAPKSRGGLAARFFFASLIVIGSVAAATAVAGLLQVQAVVNVLRIHPGITSKYIKLPAPGAPQTILLIGSDHRAGESFHDANTDTMLLVRLNAASSTINVFSIPRDLYVDVPGYGSEKINAAYSQGGYNLLIQTIRQDVFPQFAPDHIIDVNFQGFSDLVDAIGCVYSDVDHRYYNLSQPAPSPDNFSSINIQPGYQLLCGDNQSWKGALPFVRFRHTDTDLMRNARQQDFLRWAKDQYPLSKAFANYKSLLKILAKHATFDKEFQSLDGLLRLGHLLLNMNKASIKQITFPATYIPCTIDGTAEQCIGPTSQAVVQQRWAQFMAATPQPKAASKSSSSSGRPARKARSSPTLDTAGLYSDVADGRQQTAALPKVRMPVYFPRLLVDNSDYCTVTAANCDDGDEPATVYAHSYPREYVIRDQQHHPHAAYRMTVVLNYTLGEYMGVQGTTWNDPPLLASPSGKTTIDGRTLFLYRDGNRLTTVAWHHDGDAYWISNSLNESVPNRELIAVAASLMQGRS
jgi:polyisoprenyl-teichoic acid--peptidoglycan teichoic acid transferase